MIDGGSYPDRAAALMRPAHSSQRWLVRNEPVEKVVLPVYVPVALRHTTSAERARGNLIAQMVVPLPIGASRS